MSTGKQTTTERARALNASNARTTGLARRFLPPGMIVLVLAAAWIAAGDLLGFATLERSHEALVAWRDGNPLLASVLFFLAYVAVVALSIPGAIWMTLIGGFLFGTTLGAILVVGAATAGALVLFFLARTALGVVLHRRAEGWLERLEAGFRKGEVSFMLVMRLVPVVPFFVANIAPALLGARPLTFLWTTLVGILPATLVYVSIGAGLGEQFARSEGPDLGIIFEAHVLGPLLGLAALACLPLVLRRFGYGRTAQ